MVNRFMRVMVFFDLPVRTKKQRHNYSIFRKHLIRDGYTMVQFSVYSRTVRNLDDAKKHLQRLRVAVPSVDSVRVTTVTEKQYASMEPLVGSK